MEFLDLPNELILAFGDQGDLPSLLSLASTCRRLHSLLNPLLYRRNAKEQRSSALIWAAENGRVDTVNLCLSNAANINTSALSLDEERQYTFYPQSGTPLHYAIRRGHHDLVRCLLANGADPQRWCTYFCGCSLPREDLLVFNNATYIMIDCYSSLHLAMCNGHNSIAKTLIDWGASCESTLQLRCFCGPMMNRPQPSPRNVMHEIALHGNLELLTHLMSSNICLETMINSAAFDGNTPLHYLALTWPSGSADIFDRFLSLDPNVDVENDDLLRPIDCFVDEGNVGAARRLLQLGSRPYQLIRCIESACTLRLPKVDLSREAKQRVVQERNDLVLSLINHALDVGQLTRDVGHNRQISFDWYGIFQHACVQPSVLRELLRAGFRPDSLTGQDSVLLKVMEIMTTRPLSGSMRDSLLEATKMLTRAGERWDRRGQGQKTPLDQLVKKSEYVTSDLLAALFKTLLGSRLPEQTLAEQIHLNQLAQYALENRKMEIYRHLVRYGAKYQWQNRVSGQEKYNRASKHQGLVALQWFKPDLKLVTANRLGKAMGRSI